MNESVLAMIDKLHARLNDLEADVKNSPIELAGFDAKLDKIDDQVYLLEVEIEKKLKNSVPLKPESAKESESSSAASAAKSDAVNSSAEDTSSPKPEDSSESSASEEKPTSEEGQSAQSSEGILSDSAKDTIASATKSLNSLYKDGKQLFDEVSEPFADLKNIFKK